MTTGLRTAYSKLNYDVIDAQSNIPDDWRSSSPTERIQREFGQQTKVKQSFHGSVAWLKQLSAETGSKTTSEELKFTNFSGGGGGYTPRPS